MIETNNLVSLYREAFPLTARMVQRSGGSLEEAKDVFHDALLIYMEKKELQIHTSPRTYLLGIARILWLHSKKQVHFYDLPGEVQDFFIDEREQKRDDEARAMMYLQMAGQKCLEILEAFYYENLPLNDIAQRFGFNGTRSATVQKFKCLENIRSEIKKRKLHAARID